MHPLGSKRYAELIFKVASLDAAQKVSSLGLELQAKMCFVHRANPSSRKAQQSWIPHKLAQLCHQSYKLVQEFLQLWVLSPKIDLNHVTESKQHGQALSLPLCQRGCGLFCGIHLPGIDSFMPFTKVLGVFNYWNRTQCLSLQQWILLHQPALMVQWNKRMLHHWLPLWKMLQSHRIIQLKSHHHWLQVLKPPWSWTIPRRDMKNKSNNCRPRQWWNGGIALQWWK